VSLFQLSPIRGHKRQLKFACRLAKLRNLAPCSGICNIRCRLAATPAAAATRSQLRAFSELGGIKANNYSSKNICLNSEDSLAYLNWVDKFAVPLEQIKKIL